MHLYGDGKPNIFMVVMLSLVNDFIRFLSIYLYLH